MFISTQASTTGISSVHAQSTPRRLGSYGVLAAVVASGVTTALAAIASAVGVSFTDRSGSAIPILGFTELTLFFSLIGVGLAAVLARRARQPRTTFLRTVLVLLVLSYVPDLMSGFDAGSAVALIALHTIAAAIVIPTLAGRLARTR